VILDISASRVELTVLAGKEVVSTKAHRVRIPDWNENWPASVEGIASPLASLVQAASAQGLEATVLYHAPSSAVVVAPVPEATGLKQAISAAGLSLAEAANRALDVNPHDIERLWIDAAPPKTDPEAAPAQAHVLGIAESEASAAALAGVIRKSGLKLAGLVPAECVGSISAVEAILDRSKKSAETFVGLFCGEHVSVLTAATAGRLRFVRRIGMGSEMLVDALAAEFRPQGPESAAIQFDHAKASTLLFRSGIPVRGQVYDEEKGINGDAVLPLVQPVLQRSVVEIKQSLRFSLDEKERAGAKLIVLGIGSRIGRLFQLVCEQSSLVLTDPPAAPQDVSSTTCGPIYHWINGRQVHLNMLPSQARREQVARLMTRGMYVGFAASLAMLITGGWGVLSELAKQPARIQKAESLLESTRPISDLNNKMLGAQAGVANAKQRIKARMSATVPWDAVMLAIADCTPPSIKIHEAQMYSDKGKPCCKITGHTPVPEAGDANSTLRKYVDALCEVPLVKGARLGATQRTESDHGPSMTFDLTLTLIELPAVVGRPNSDLAQVAGVPEDHK
jgi:hypothetical protein